MNKTKALMHFSQLSYERRGQVHPEAGKFGSQTTTSRSFLKNCKVGFNLGGTPQELFTLIEQNSPEETR